MADQLKFDQLTLSRPPGRRPRTYTVSQLVRLASRKLEVGLGEVWVEGEVSNLRCPSSGHCYFTLKDAGAQLPVVIFRRANSRLGFQLEDGQQLCCKGFLGIYDAQGRFQLTAQTAEPLGLGALQLAFEQLKARLQAEGLFSAERKRHPPLLPRTIAVVTSPTGAAIRDIIRVLHDRCPSRIIVCPTPVQGEDAPAGIVAALRRADRLDADLIIIGRGGGSIEDLWAFNTERVARAISQASTPIISAVGHEVDLTIADLVADLRAATPSNAAELAAPVQAELADELLRCRSHLSGAMGRRLDRRRVELEQLRRRMGTPRGLLDRRRMDLDTISTRLADRIGRLLSGRRQRWMQLEARLGLQQPHARLGRDRAALAALRVRLEGLARERVARRRQILVGAAARLEALSPLAVLERGYALVLDEDRAVVRDPARLIPGEAVVLRFAGGEVRCVVSSSEENRALTPIEQRAMNEAERDPGRA